MSLPSGTRLGPYEIQSAIGAGGMGEVYKARDTRRRPGSPRPVRARGEDHRRPEPPACLPLFDVGEHEGSMYVVMKHPIGQTPAERLKKGPLGLSRRLESVRPNVLRVI